MLKFFSRLKHFLTLDAESKTDSADVKSNPLSLDSAAEGIVLVNGCYVNVEQLMERLQETELGRRNAESRLKSSHNQLGNLNFIKLSAEMEGLLCSVGNEDNYNNLINLISLVAFDFQSFYNYI